MNELLLTKQATYTAIQHLDHDQFGYIVTDPATGRCLGGVGANYYRAWGFPLYTPNGLTVIQEFPFDHPFHNGFWVAQGPIFLEGREVTFWPAPPMRKANEALFTHMGRMETLGKPEITQHHNGVRFTLNLTWRDKDEQPVLDEVRTIDLYAVEDATICDMRSSKSANYGALDFAQTKFGSIGIRVEPRLLPQFGGVVIGDGGRRGSAEQLVDQESDFVAYENELAGRDRFGVFMSSLEPDRRGPWFVRDYGMALYAPTRKQAIHLPKGESWCVALRVAAYDGQLSNQRSQRWQAIHK